MKSRKIGILLAMTSAVVIGAAGCGNAAWDMASLETAAVDAAESETENTETQADTVDNNIPKYVFLFIGDGMSYPQVKEEKKTKGFYGAGNAYRSHFKL